MTLLFMFLLFLVLFVVSLYCIPNLSSKINILGNITLSLLFAFAFVFGLWKTEQHELKFQYDRLSKQRELYLVELETTNNENLSLEEKQEIFKNVVNYNEEVLLYKNYNENLTFLKDMFGDSRFASLEFIDF